MSLAFVWSLREPHSQLGDTMPWETSPISPSALGNKEGGRASKLKLHETLRQCKGNQ